MICIASNNPERQYFKGMFDEIKNGDIVFIKSIKRQDPRYLRIFAIGQVKENDKSFLSDYGYSKKVNWFHYNPDGIIDIDLISDGGIQRNTRIFREYNPNIIIEIDKLVERYR